MERPRKIHVLVIVRHPIGGIRTFLRYVYSQFETEKFQFTLLLPKTAELDTLRENLNTTDCDFQVLKQNASLMEFTKALFRILKTRDIDIVHSHGFTSMVFSILPASLYKKPHLLTSHDVFTNSQFKGVKGFLRKMILGMCFRFVDTIHSVSHGANDNLLFYFPRLKKKTSKLVVIPNGIETKRFFIEDREDWRKQLNLSKGTFLIGFLGRFMAQKGFKYLIESFNDILLKMKNDVQPVVLCFGWGGFVREEQAEIERRGLEKNFLFLPFQENPARAIRGVDVVVMPSLWEACPLLPMEVLVAGVPVIGTDCVGMHEVLLDTPARIIPSADSKALAEAIIAEIEISSKERVEHFRAKAVERFSVTQQAKSLKLLISKLVDV